MIMRRVVEAVNELTHRIRTDISAVETGTIRSYSEKHESTRHIAQTLGDKGKLTSIDICPKSIELSKKICESLDNITWIQSDATEYLLKTQEKYDFVLLDSKNCAQTIWNEFKAVLPKLNPGAIVIIDDAGILPDGSGKDPRVPAQKGHMIWDKLHEKMKVKVLSAPHGQQLRLDLDAQTINKIKDLQ